MSKRRPKNDIIDFITYFCCFALKLLCAKPAQGDGLQPCKLAFLAATNRD